MAAGGTAAGLVPGTCGTVGGLMTPICGVVGGLMPVGGGGMAPPGGLIPPGGGTTTAAGADGTLGTTEVDGGRGTDVTGEDPAVGGGGAIGVPGVADAGGTTPAAGAVATRTGLGGKLMTLSRGGTMGAGWGSMRTVSFLGSDMAFCGLVWALYSKGCATFSNCHGNVNSLRVFFLRVPVRICFSCLRGGDFRGLRFWESFMDDSLIGPGIVPSSEFSTLGT